MDYLLDEKGASARHLVLMFLAAVAVCAVFFSLGFVVGYNRSPSKAGLASENVTASGDIPPTVNPPTAGSSAPPPSGMQTEKVSPGPASIPQAEHPEPLPPEPVAIPQLQTKKPVEKPAPRKTVTSKPAAPPRSQPATPPPASSGSHFAVQVMASRNRVDAENLVKLLKSHGYPAFVLTPQQSHAKDNLYRVQVGPFSSRVVADTTRDKLEGEGFRPFVVH